jgi:hypothetical protein
MWPPQGCTLRFIPGLKDRGLRVTRYSDETHKFANSQKSDQLLDLAIGSGL